MPKDFQELLADHRLYHLSRGPRLLDDRLRPMRELFSCQNLGAIPRRPA